MHQPVVEIRRGTDDPGPGNTSGRHDLLVGGLQLDLLLQGGATLQCDCPVIGMATTKPLFSPSEHKGHYPPKHHGFHMAWFKNYVDTDNFLWSS